MRYLSTRDADARAGFCEILLTGLAPDGGLYLPETYPQFTDEDLADWRTVLTTEGYAALGSRVLSRFIDDLSPDDLLGCCQRAWNGEVFATAEIVPVTRLPFGEGETTDADAGLWLAHLSTGPTAAFKDLAMQLLGQLFEFELTRRGERLTIVGATSGDTGSAAEHALLNRRGIETFMLTPAGRMSPFQQAQLFSVDDPAVHNLAVDGVFDDCQDLVKAVMADQQFKQRHRLSVVNSINWARLVAQVVYYVASWLQVTDPDRPTQAQPVSFVVPTGNFGNICAGHIARQCGLPIAELVVATNENDVLHEFFSTGTYRPRSAADTPATSSPSMDISKASNLERFIFDLVGRDASRVRELFGERLINDGHFTLIEAELGAAREQFGFRSGRSTHAERIDTIRACHAATGITLDPHTADGVTVAGRLGSSLSGPVVVLETALPVKFAATIVEALGAEPPMPERFAGLLSAPRRVDPLPNDVAALKTYIETHSGQAG